MMKHFPTSRNQTTRIIKGLRAFAGVMTLAIVVPMFLPACNDGVKNTLDLTIDPETTATMMTRDVSTLISDSGITRYHITAPLWLVYGEAREPKWKFPNGLFLEKFDDQLRQDATVQADSATYLERQRVWRLDGNVRITNPRNEKFLTEQLFWDQRQQKVYSDSFIHIERQDRIIEGYGFSSNDRLTAYQVHSVAGIFPVSQFTPGGRADDSHSPAPTAQPMPQARIVGHENIDESTTVTPVAVRTDSLSVAHRHAVDLRARRRRVQQTDSLKKSTPAP